VTVKIYREEKAAGTYYRVGYYLGAKRCWLHCATLDEAKKEAAAKAAQLSRGDVDAAQLTGRDRLVYGRALEALRPTGATLDSAAIEYAEARKLLGAHSLIEAVRFYIRHHGQGIRAKSVSEGVEEMIAAKKIKGVSELYLADLLYRLGAFRDAFKCDVNTIAPDDLRDWFATLKLAPRSFNNFVRTVGTFLSFAKSNGWLAKDLDLLASVERRKEKAAPVEIFSPEELASILSHASHAVAPCMALTAFAGVRSEEILRLKWSDLERRRGFIEVAADRAKTAQRRLVPITPNLAEWLATAPRKDARVWPHSKPYLFESFRNAVKAANAAAKKSAGATAAAKIVWKTNALRHSFITYRLADIQDTNRVALEAGNSPGMIFKHYRELATPEQGKTWFSVRPQKAENIVPIGEAAA